MLTLHGVAYEHPNKELLFASLDLHIGRQQKLALVGNNGSGKSTLLRLMAGLLPPTSGHISTASPPYYVPQHFGQYDDLSVAAALGIADAWAALRAILGGSVAEEHFSVLGDNWDLEERARAALACWGLAGIDLNTPMGSLSGGQKTKVFLSGIAIHRPALVLLDEPSNHLDAAARRLLQEWVRDFSGALLLVSHDRALLNSLDTVLELSARGLMLYGGNYNFYAAQKALQHAAFEERLRDRGKALRKAKETARESMERQQKLDARGKKKQEQAGLPTISMNTLRNKAEQSTARLKDVHHEKIKGLAQELESLRDALPDLDKMKLDFDGSALHAGKVLFTATDLNHTYGQQQLWKKPLAFTITSGERIALRGGNGAGKTTLLRLLLGILEPIEGSLQRAVDRAVYLDQDYSLLQEEATVYLQAQSFNTTALPEPEVKRRLTHFLFTKDDWDKPCAALSGGERMRLALCCLTIGEAAPDLIVLDEPGNNLDLQNLAILSAAVRSYEGTLLVVSHDELLLSEIGITREIGL